MGQAIGLILLILGIVALTFVIIYSLMQIMGKSNAAKILQYGRDREYFIYEMLTNAFNKDTVLHNLYFPVVTKEGTFDTEVDIVCVTRGGIAVIEVKGNKGMIHCPPSDTWRQRYGKKVLQFKNPYIQNEGHIKAIRKALEKKGLSNVPIKNYVVFTDIHTQFSHRYPWLIRSDNIVETLERLDDKLILTRRDQRIIAQIMRNHKRRKHMTFKQKDKNRRTKI
ncbi:MAG: NERD domain-containing protein [Clostridia bacterium]|nr:NERD domain-containing protein [Clostridia bacterium]